MLATAVDFQRQTEQELATITCPILATAGYCWLLLATALACLLMLDVLRPQPHVLRPAIGTRAEVEVRTMLVAS